MIYWKKKNEHDGLSSDDGLSSVEVFESQFKTMTTMQLLGHGLATPLHRQHGWLKALLLQEGITFFWINTHIIITTRCFACAL
jgi:hypothetical protein